MDYNELNKALSDSWLPSMIDAITLTTLTTLFLRNEPIKSGNRDGFETTDVFSANT